VTAIGNRAGAGASEDVVGTCGYGAMSPGEDHERAVKELSVLVSLSIEPGSVDRLCELGRSVRESPADSVGAASQRVVIVVLVEEILQPGRPGQPIKTTKLRLFWPLLRARHFSRI
jgi:hypothetical protein